MKYSVKAKGDKFALMKGDEEIETFDTEDEAKAAMDDMSDDGSDNSKKAYDAAAQDGNFLTKLWELVKDKLLESDWKQAVKTARAYAGGKKSRRTKKVDDPEQASEDIVEEPKVGSWDYAYDGGYGVAVKFEKQDSRVNYQKAESVGSTCGDCVHWCYGSCDIVEGMIDRNFTCTLFTPSAMAASELVSYAASETGNKLFLPFSFSDTGDLPTHIPYFPKPGTYTHNDYGKIVITRERNQHFVDNFNAGVYQTNLPIDAEHETKLSGAFGWVVGMKLNEDGSVDAKAEWTDRGKIALAEKRFKYVSPEWFERWKDPMTEKTFTDVAIGLALCTRPFFKEGGLRALVASERGLTVYKGATSMPEDKDKKPTAGGDGNDPAKATDPPKVDTTTGTLEQRFAASETARQDLERRLVASESKLAKMETDDQTRRFKDIVTGKAGNTAWTGGTVEKHVDMLVKLAKAFGEDSDDFKSFVADRNTKEKELIESPKFASVGSKVPQGESADSATGKIMAAAEQLAKDKNISKADAISQIANDPQYKDLYEQHAVAAQTIVNKG